MKSKIKDLSCSNIFFKIISIGRAPIFSRPIVAVDDGLFVCPDNAAGDTDDLVLASTFGDTDDLVPDAALCDADDDDLLVRPGNDICIPCCVPFGPLNLFAFMADDDELSTNIFTSVSEFCDPFDDLCELDEFLFFEEVLLVVCCDFRVDCRCCNGGLSFVG